MTPEEQYAEFLNKHGVMWPVQENSFPIITYNQYKCAVIITNALRVVYIEIKPLSTEWDIGNGAGGAVFKNFSNQ